LTQQDDVVLESRNVQHVDELDLLPYPAKECHNALAFNWDNKPITKMHSPLHGMVKQWEQVGVSSLVARCLGVEVPPFQRIIVVTATAGAEEDVRHWFMNMNATITQLRVGSSLISQTRAISSDSSSSSWVRLTCSFCGAWHSFAQCPLLS
jgi:hypothetical protein